MKTSTVHRCRVSARAAIAATCCLASALASTADADVRINEVLFNPGILGSGHEGFDHEWVELYNAGPADVNLAGTTITAGDGVVAATLPAWNMPADTWLTVHFDVGTDDSDFDDRRGDYYVGAAIDVFDTDEDECAIYSGAPGAGTITDFVSWSGLGAYVPDVAHGFATGAGIWAPGAYIDVTSLPVGYTILRYFDGYDSDTLDDWWVMTWSVYVHSNGYIKENPVQEVPFNRSISDTDTPTFDWVDVPFADDYELQVDNDVDFSSPVINVTVAASDYTPGVGLADDVYFWRVRANVGGQPTVWATEWSVVVLPGLPVPARASRGQVNCQHLWQRKDTQLLCLWDERNDTRPGCPETGNCRWDAAHPNSNPPTNGCQHGRMYCVPTSIAMVNRAYGGDLSIDRCAYNMNAPRRAAPEGDLGHNQGYAPPPGSNQETNGLSWAMNNAAVTVTANPTFAQLTGFVDDQGCFMARIPGHMVVIDNYLSYTSLSTGTVIQILYSEDPWRGPSVRFVYNYIFNFTPTTHASALHRTTRLAHAFTLPSSGVTARMQEASVTTDSDGDGIMDFDEANPRTLESNRMVVDTDRDQVDDKFEILNYTFHDTYHVGHENDALTFPDVDGDGMRAENDCDSDTHAVNGGDGDFDGGEDTDGDGQNPDAGMETCQFDPTDSLISVDVDRTVYLIGDPVFLIDPPTRTYHYLSTYNYELGGDCPPRADGDGLGHTGAFATDIFGTANAPHLVEMCTVPGLRHLTVDVLDDNLVSIPDCIDPQTCWYCIFPPTFLTVTTITDPIDVEVPGSITVFVDTEMGPQPMIPIQFITTPEIEFISGEVNPDAPYMTLVETQPSGQATAQFIAHQPGFYSIQAFIPDTSFGDQGFVNVLPPQECPGDADGDLDVDFDDLNTVLANWAQKVPPGTQGDVDFNGFIDFDDLNTVLGNWGLTCGIPVN